MVLPERDKSFLSRDTVTELSDLGRGRAYECIDSEFKKFYGSEGSEGRRRRRSIISVVFVVVVVSSGIIGSFLFLKMFRFFPHEN